MMTGFVFVMGLMACSQQDEEVKTQVPETRIDSEHEQGLTEVKHYNRIATWRLAQNDTLIIALRKNATRKQPQETPGYNAALDDLEQKNAELKNRIKIYRYASKEKWKTFKSGFNHDMYEVVHELDKLADWWK